VPFTLDADKNGFSLSLILLKGEKKTRRSVGEIWENRISSKRVSGASQITT
jgi:hypothetical protein